MGLFTSKTMLLATFFFCVCASLQFNGSLNMGILTLIERTSAENVTVYSADLYIDLIKAFFELICWSHLKEKKKQTAY